MEHKIYETENNNNIKNNDGKVSNINSNIPENLLDHRTVDDRKEKRESHAKRKKGSNDKPTYTDMISFRVLKEQRSYYKLIADMQNKTVADMVRDTMIKVYGKVEDGYSAIRDTMESETKDVNDKAK